MGRSMRMVMTVRAVTGQDWIRPAAAQQQDRDEGQQEHSKRRRAVI